MKSRRAPTRWQYEPIVTPTTWRGEERQLCVRLTQLLDALYQKCGELDARLRAVEKEVDDEP